MNGCLDCGNSLLAGLPDTLLRRLQSVQNAAASMIYRLRRFDHISNALIELHSLALNSRAYRLQTCNLGFLFTAWLCAIPSFGTFHASLSCCGSSSSAFHVYRFLFWPCLRSLSDVAPLTLRHQCRTRCQWTLLQPTIITFCHRLKTSLFKRSFLHVNIDISQFPCRFSASSTPWGF